jgi:hypothetical protein
MPPGISFNESAMIEMLNIFTSLGKASEFSSTAQLGPYTNS